LRVFHEKEDDDEIVIFWLNSHMLKGMFVSMFVNYCSILTMDCIVLLLNCTEVLMIVLGKGN